MIGKRVAIIGAGIAGTDAAAELAQFGGETHLFDRFEIPEMPAGVVSYPETPVWGLFPRWRVTAARGGESVVLDVDAVLLTNGLTDRVSPFAGHTLPGVMTASGLSRLISRWRILPGRRFVIIGDGDEAGSVAEAIRDAEGQIVEIIDPQRARSLAASGDGGVAEIEIDNSKFQADIVVMAVGTQPDLTLAAMAECQLAFDEVHQRWQIWRDEHLRSSVAGIWAAGSVAGSAGSDCAAAEGRFAAASIAQSLGMLDQSEFNVLQRTVSPSPATQAIQAADSAILTRQPWRPDERILAESSSDHG